MHTDPTPAQGVQLFQLTKGVGERWALVPSGETFWEQGEVKAIVGVGKRCE